MKPCKLRQLEHGLWKMVAVSSISAPAVDASIEQHCVQVQFEPMHSLWEL